MKLLASDFDGTLLLHPNKNENIVLDIDKKAIKDFQKKGNLFGVCTGRSLNGVLRCIDDIEFDFYILNSGAVILNKNKDIIESHYLDKELIKKIIDLFDEKICCTFVDCDKMYVLNPGENLYDHLQEITSVDLLSQQIEAFSMHFEDDVQKTTEIMNKIKDRFQNQISIYQNIDNIDMCAKGCSKGHGIKAVKRYFSLEEDDIFVIGDSWNDIPMFESCRHSFTFYHSPQDVQEKAKYQVHHICECIDFIINQ